MSNISSSPLVAAAPKADPVGATPKDGTAAPIALGWVPKAAPKAEGAPEDAPKPEGAPNALGVPPNPPKAVEGAVLVAAAAGAGVPKGVGVPKGGAEVVAPKAGWVPAAAPKPNGGAPPVPPVPKPPI